METSSSATSVVISGPMVYTGGLLGVMAEIQALFIGAPLLAFILCGVFGGVSGWAFGLETGKLDRLTLRGHACFVFRRVLIGLTVAVMTWLIWPLDKGEVATGGMLFVGLLGAFPTEVVGTMKETALEFLKKRMG